MNAPVAPSPPPKTTGKLRTYFTSLMLCLWFAMALSLGFFAGRFPAITEHLFGHNYDLKNAADLAALRRLTYQAQPLIDAMEAHLAKGGKIPGTPEDIPGLPQHYWETYENLHYLNRSEESSYGIYIKLNWDASLQYEHATRKWDYDPGDGRPTTELSQ